MKEKENSRLLALGIHADKRKWLSSVKDMIKNKPKSRTFRNESRYILEKESLNSQEKINQSDIILL